MSLQGAEKAMVLDVPSFMPKLCSDQPGSDTRLTGYTSSISGSDEGLGDPTLS
jgi:hypothetical protein